MDPCGQPELLAPAGGMEQLAYAVRFGADAAYLAADRFGLRQRANNFALADIPAAATFAHGQGVRLFVTCNAYLNDDDLKALPGYLEALAQAGVDAIIASDLAVFRMARKHAPGVALHVSTQASCSNTESALMWHELGAKRIVCARELSLDQIAVMRAALPPDLELEVFVHGAMCMAISGRCLISDYMTGRSANRGHCTQPCRWQYALEEETRPGEFFPVEEDARGTYLMNSKDLCMLRHLDDLVAAGVDSLKIEGRNKKAFYVATVVNAYRRVLDGAPASDYLPELETVSHRPYSTGFFYGAAEQTAGADVYDQSYDWVGEVLGAPRGGRVMVACRNRFFEGDELEVLSPSQPAAAPPPAQTAATPPTTQPAAQPLTLTVRDLRLEFPDGGFEPVATANRAMDTYSFATEADLQRMDILRVRRADPARKN